MSPTAELSGVAASPGIAIGPVVMLRHVDPDIPDVDDPIGAVNAAAATVSAELMETSARVRAGGRDEAADVLQAQSLIAGDEMIADAVAEELESGATLHDAFARATEALRNLLASLPDPYLAQRAADVGEVMHAIGCTMAGVERPSMAFVEPSVLVAHEVSAAETSELDPSLVLGLVTETGGATSHVAIIARSLGVPCVTGVRGLMETDPSSIAIDGSTGDLQLDPDDSIRADFEARAAAAAKLRARVDEVQGQAVRYGEHAMSIAANVAGPDDVDAAARVESDGVGLYRTEFLFLDRPAAPTEDEQYEQYRHAVESFDNEVVIRSFDIGGDKPADYLGMPSEENPFLGVRGVRLYEAHQDLIDGQLRAVLRAAVHGSMALMVPMVADVAELRWVRGRLDACRAALSEANVAVGDVKVGVMVEVPSVALTTAAYAGEADFFSIGTNDLTQYTMAADRMDGRLVDLHDAMHPAVARLCAMVADGAHANGASSSVCGLAAADPVSAVVFAALGIDKLSVSTGSVNLIRATVLAQDPANREAITEAVWTAATAAELRERVGALMVDP